MSLIKCTHCGRPFYDNVEACPYCGHATKLSANSRVTKAISTPSSRKTMEDFFSGNLQQPSFRPVHSKPLLPDPEPEPAPAPEPVPEPEPIPEPVPEPEHVPAPEPTPPSNTVIDRAESIAAIKSDNIDAPADIDVEEPHEVETTLPKKKRHGWLWIIFLVLILAIAAAVYLKWDFIIEKITSLIG